MTIEVKLFKEFIGKTKSGSSVFLRNTVSTLHFTYVYRDNNRQVICHIIHIYVYVYYKKKEVISQTKEQHNVQILSPHQKLITKLQIIILKILCHINLIFSVQIYFRFSATEYLHQQLANSYDDFLPCIFSFLREMKETTVGIMRSDQAQKQICYILLGLTSLQLLFFFSFSFSNHYSLRNMN